MHAGIPPPREQTPPAADTPPPAAGTPTAANTPWEQTPPGSRHPPAAGIPLRSACWEIRSTSWNLKILEFKDMLRVNDQKELFHLIVIALTF